MIAIALVVIVSVVAVIGYYGWKLYSVADQTYEPVDRLPSNVRAVETSTDSDEDKDKAKEVDESVVKSFLILGTGTRRDNIDSGLADVIMVGIVNEETGKITLMSIPRDSYVEIAGKGYKDKINHSFSFGVPTTIATVENFIDIPIDYYTVFNFNGFKNAVDAIGGVEVDVDRRISGTNPTTGERITLEQGEQLLTGDQAKDVRSPAKVERLLDAVDDGIRTDLPFRKMVSLAPVMAQFSSGDVEQITLETRSSRFGERNLWYELVSEEEQQRIQQLLKERYYGTEPVIQSSNDD